jgi:RNA polymerase sigma factor (sigma-70 family)
VGHEELYLAHLRVIEDVIRFVSRRHALREGDADDFASVVRLHLVEDDYRVLRSFQNRSSLKTFLTTVIQRQFLDWQNARWGKWRPTIDARRQGPVAVLLERLIVRDGLTVDEAIETVRTNHQVAATRNELLELAARVASRQKRQFVSEEVLENLVDRRADSEATVRAIETEALAARAQQALERVTAQLAHQDRVILRMRFEDGFSVADIARALHLDQKSLYRRLDGLMGRLRRDLEALGIDGNLVEMTLD